MKTKDEKFEFWFFFWLHVLEALGSIFILAFFVFALIIADAIIKGTF